ncbi:hypothetical protein GUITHDRAFT_70468 [Guillardia theta CCMP2712]|uniref:protein-ribulosamine 3-kinase n=1 Tax=Guillardia theta (strain CCMP2712) TaxID=905079 RepID=L1JE26_GUITC|nr:hypothetical protein GUITHDRAFT_70468 [Guillardia theta CCMP2712]EKX46572.1 hypothetical protein GUITHDRAFT_70468 [Guillardia theta CCMP2712]|eukprot:XP_005833552.1 hypothetical protein GUITHDRAFT_70468 [Guillardia theta CCMP2712]
MCKKIAHGSDLACWSSDSWQRYKTEDGKDFFVKTARQSAEKIFKGEALGLNAMYHAEAVGVPKVDGGRGGTLGPVEVRGAGSFIIMEYLSLGSPYDQYDFGKAMAKMHLAEPLAKEAKEGNFGFDVDNTIGGTPQPNKWDKDWVRFFREQRIGHQVNLAGDGQLERIWDKVARRTLFEGIQVKPSVLHGDLWSGNYGGSNGRPCIYDPAVYYGHHEAEWGMSWCASFGSNFWKGYRELIPEDPGFRERRVLYELYHKLNHYNLFGGGYYSDAVSLMESLAK